MVFLVIMETIFTLKEIVSHAFADVQEELILNIVAVQDLLSTRQPMNVIGLTILMLANKAIQIHLIYKNKVLPLKTEIYTN